VSDHPTQPTVEPYNTNSVTLTVSNVVESNKSESKSESTGFES